MQKLLAYQEPIGMLKEMKDIRDIRSRAPKHAPSPLSIELVLTQCPSMERMLLSSCVVTTTPRSYGDSMAFVVSTIGH
jgi:hypothetical protein